MAHDTTYQLRIDTQIKNESFAVFREMGMTPAEGMRIFLQMVAKTKSIPFPIHVPNAKTAAQLLSKDDKKNFQRFDSMEALFADLGD